MFHSLVVVVLWSEVIEHATRVMHTALLDYAPLATNELFTLV